MKSAHDPIARLAAGFAGSRDARILDLGCGNGALLAKIVEYCPRVIPFGVDADKEKVEHAQMLHSSCTENFRAVDMFDVSFAVATG